MATAPVFSNRNVSALTPVMSADDELSAHRIAMAGKRTVNMPDELIETTLDAIADVTFFNDGSFDHSAVHRAI